MPVSLLIATLVSTLSTFDRGIMSGLVLAASILLAGIRLLALRFGSVGTTLVGSLSTFDLGIMAGLIVAAIVCRICHCKNSSAGAAHRART